VRTYRGAVQLAGNRTLAKFLIEEHDQFADGLMRLAPENCCYHVDPVSPPF
jgi:hypothetical protein